MPGMMTQTWNWAGLMTITMALLLGTPQSEAATPERPNIIFIFTDDHASHAISAYGSKINQTPNLDRLADEGMLFRNVFVTNSICAPSRAVLLTGKPSHLNGQLTNRERFDGEQQTFPKLLQKAGYNTAIIGKWHLGSDPTGFDHWSVLPGQGHYYNPDFRTAEGRVNRTGYVTDIITDDCLAWLESGRDADKPFLLMYHHKAPHREWMPGPDHLTLYDDGDLPEPATLFDDYADRSAAASQQEMEIDRHMFLGYDLKVPPTADSSDREKQMWRHNAYHRMNDEQKAAWDAAYGPKNEAFREANLEGKALLRWKYQRYVKDYLRTIASVDDNIGRVMDYLEETGLDENTIVVYASDQGFYLGDHGWYDKRFIYEESLRTPLIIKWPGVTKPGSENTDMVSNLDWAATLLDVAGVTVPDDMQGRSLAPLLRGQTPDDWRDSVYYHYYEFPAVHMVNRHYGVRTQRYKLIHFYQLGEWEMYDLEADPDELRSIYDDPNYAEVQARLKTELRRLQEHHGDDRPHASAAEIAQRRYIDRLDKVQLQQVAAYDEGAGQTRSDLDPSIKTFTVGAHAVPQGDGVLVAQGGASHGYTLFIEDGVPTFAIRSGGVLHKIVGPNQLPMDESVHLAGVLDAQLDMHLYVNGERVATDEGALLVSKPANGFSVGGNPGSPVGDYDVPFTFEGEIRDLRVYWGVLGDDAIKDWAAD
ncbi:MAG: sulfatase/phosphatase domain-containing protein [Phycisphaeraceae bacterium]